ncbi:MAG: hypothetical protein IJH65_16885 [Methanobrevibacter sp.]|nr:hypothetical protein [Methanobrevibacter sp.]
MNKSLALLITTIIGVIITAVCTIVAKIEWQYGWILIAALGAINEIINLVLEYLANKEK